MPSIIDFEIQERSYERIRDRVGLILAAELANQHAITYNDLFDVKVFVQRTKPIQPEECPLINISIDSGQYSNSTVIDSDGSFRILIHVFTRAESDGNDRGDVLASKEAQKLAGVTQAILMNPRYVTLLFERPFIMRSKIESFGAGIIEKGEATNLAVVESVLTVLASENETASDATELNEISTTVCLYNTENGYLYSGTPIEPIPNPPCPGVPYSITNTNEDVLYSGTVESGFSLNEEIQNATAVLKDTDGNVLSTTEILAENSEDIEAPNGVVNINSFRIGSVLSGGTKDINVTLDGINSGSWNIATQTWEVLSGTCQDADYVLTDSDGNILDSGTIPSGDTDDITAPDATYSNSDNSYSGSVLSGGSLSIPDSQINVNGVDEGDVVSVKTIDVNITDGTNPVTPDAVSLSGNTLTIEVPASGGCNRFPLVTGQTTVYETNDNGTIQFGREAAWLTLSENNPFGNTSRFTDLLGGSTYSDGVSLDWAYRNDADQLVVGWQIADNGSDINWADAITYCEGLTLATYSDWHLPQDELLNTLKATQYTRALGYAPFNNITNVRWWSSTTPSAIVPTQALSLPSQFYGVPPSAAKTTTSQFRAKAYRVFTYAELGL
jgi:hypothetical protein